MATGLTVRFALTGFPSGVRKWGGSLLWAFMVYWLVAFLFPYRRVTTLGGIAGAVATIVEVAKLYHSAELDRFRRTLAGILLLGSVFSFRDIAAYWVAISIAVGIDRSLIRGGQP